MRLSFQETCLEFSDGVRTLEACRKCPPVYGELSDIT